MFLLTVIIFNKKTAFYSKEQNYEYEVRRTQYRDQRKTEG